LVGLGVSMETGLVSCEWLKAELEREGAGKVHVVDSTWYLPNSPFAVPEGCSGAQAAFSAGPRLPGSVFFDVDAVSSQHPMGLPHMLPNEETFSAAMAALGIEPDARVVVYDRHGVFSAPRFWYTLKVAFGHQGDVAVLDGGLPRWLELGFLVEEGEAAPPPPPAKIAEWKRVLGSSWDVDQVRANIDSRAVALVDARPGPRFLGLAPEPRAGMRGGHIPGSLSVPFLDLLTSPKGQMKPRDELDRRLREATIAVDELTKPGELCVVSSCGSGLTACIVGLALHQLGMPLSRWGVYDGSWSEWGAIKDTPIMKQGADGSEEPVP